MGIIRIKELQNWLSEYITNSIHKLESENSKEFNEWAKSFKKEEAEFVVGMEFINDWGYDEREEIPKEEAIKYAESLIKTIVDNWYL